MKFALFPKGKPFNMVLDVVVARPIKLGITIFDPITKRIYSERKVQLSRSRKILFKLPIVPDELRTKVVDLSLNLGAKTFKVNEIKIKADTKCPVELTQGDKKFIRFAKWFSINATGLEAGKQGTLYQSEGFTLFYLDKLVENGVELTTPARIQRESGVIEISKKSTQDYSVPMLVVMLLHEYSHKWKNKEYGRKVSNELTADLIAIHIALNLGFDPRDVVSCFKAVFAKKDTLQNQKRLSAIKDFIKIFIGSERKRCKR
jgi:hypothetical protein